MEEYKDFEYDGKTVKKITFDEAKRLKLETVGSANSQSLGHAVYLMHKYCSEKSKLRYYSIDIEVIDEETGNARQIIRFWKEGSS